MFGLASRTAAALGDPKKLQTGARTPATHELIYGKTPFTGQPVTPNSALPQRRPLGAAGPIQPVGPITPLQTASTPAPSVLPHVQPVPGTIPKLNAVPQSAAADAHVPPTPTAVTPPTAGGVMQAGGEYALPVPTGLNTPRPVSGSVPSAPLKSVGHGGDVVPAPAEPSLSYLQRPLDKPKQTPAGFRGTNFGMNPTSPSQGGGTMMSAATMQPAKVAYSQPSLGAKPASAPLPQLNNKSPLQQRLDYAESLPARREAAGISGPLPQVDQSTGLGFIPRHGSLDQTIGGSKFVEGGTMPSGTRVLRNPNTGGFSLVGKAAAVMEKPAVEPGYITDPSTGHLLTSKGGSPMLDDNGFPMYPGQAPKYGGSPGTPGIQKGFGGAPDTMTAATFDAMQKSASERQFGADGLGGTYGTKLAADRKANGGMTKAEERAFVDKNERILKNARQHGLGLDVPAVARAAAELRARHQNRLNQLAGQSGKKGGTTPVQEGPMAGWVKGVPGSSAPPVEPGEYTNPQTGEKRKVGLPPTPAEQAAMDAAMRGGIGGGAVSHGPNKPKTNGEVAWDEWNPMDHQSGWGRTGINIPGNMMSAFMRWYHGNSRNSQKVDKPGML